MLIQVQFEGSGHRYTYHCPDDTNVCVGDKVDVGTARTPTVVAVGDGGDRVKDIVRVLPRTKWKTTYTGKSGHRFVHEWLTDKDARDYLTTIMRTAMGSLDTIQSLTLERCGDR